MNVHSYKVEAKKVTTLTFGSADVCKIDASINNGAPEPATSTMPHKIFCRDDCLKVELAETLKKIAPEPIYMIDEIARSYGHEVIRTPPYHPELQPIEICWGVVKNHVASKCDFTTNNLIKRSILGLPGYRKYMFQNHS